MFYPHIFNRFGPNMLSWLNQSITRKIGGLSTVLLGFIFVVILYSIIKLHVIGIEMREVAEIDIPLTEVMSEIEMLQLEQHVLVEKLRQAIQLNAELEGKRFLQLKANINTHSKDIREHIKAASEIISSGIQRGVIVEKLDDHQRVLEQLEMYLARRERLVSRLADLISFASSDNAWSSVELELQITDEMSEALLRELEVLTEEIARNAEKHEREFFVVNTALGVSAFLIGIYITLYIITSFRAKVGRIQGQINTIHDSITKGKQPTSLIEPFDGEDELAGLARNINDVVERFSDEMNNRYEVEKQLIQLATTDKLTGAFNRHKWDEVLPQEVELAQRNCELSLVLIDLDHFKKVNDTFGHDIGDLVLKHAADVIRSTVRKSDMLFRLGGEEFALLCRNMNAGQASHIANQIREAFLAVNVAGLPAFTASFGIAEHVVSDTGESLFKRADSGLYESKETGRNKVTFQKV